MGKLVRDNIPKIIIDAGKRPKVHHLTRQADFQVALLDKLEEETLEVRNAKDSYELMQELADVYEVISWLAKMAGSDITEVKVLAKIKRATRGSFKRAIVLDEVEDNE